MVFSETCSAAMFSTQLPCCEGPGLPGLADAAGVSLLLQLADGLGRVGAGLALDVAAVGLAVVLDADGDVAVPLPVLAEVDRGGTV
jgi:hypothetical protein